ncbi:MAG: SRPBCC domain-containing protein, partial [Proteobacteria bacterium]|nr:SRPBCC domain-containing protein [Pseudomonadota bacterium]
PESYTLTGEGRGGPAGHAKIVSRVRLVEDGEATIMHYEVKADIGGKLAQLGGQLVEKTSKKLAAEFFQKFEEILNPDGQQAQTAVADAEMGGDNRSWLWIAGGTLALIVIAWLVF